MANKREGDFILNNYDKDTGVPFNSRIITEFPDGTPITDADVDNKVLLKNSSRNGGGYSVRSFDVGQSKTLTVGNIEAIRNLSKSDILMFRLGIYTNIKTEGYYEPNDGGGFDYIFDHIGSNSDDNLYYIKPLLLNKGVFNPIIIDKIDIKIAGAIGNGVYLNDNQFEAVINLSKELNKPIFVSDGIFLVSDEYEIGNNDLTNITIRGESKGTSIIRKDGIDTTPIINGGGISLVIENITFSSPNTIEWGRAMIELTHGKHIHISNCNILNGERGIWLRCKSNSTIEDVTINGCSIDNVRSGIYIGDSNSLTNNDITKNIRITDTSITNGKGVDDADGGDGIKTYKKCDDLIINATYISGFVRDAIDLYASGERTVISSCILKGSGSKAIDIKSGVGASYDPSVWGGTGRYLNITNCIIENNNVGISIASDSTDVTRFNHGINITGNQFIGNRELPIQLFGRYVNVSNNFFTRNCTKTGSYNVIQLGRDAGGIQFVDGCIISNNLIVNNGNVDGVCYGIRMSINCKDTILSGNVISNDPNLENPNQKRGIYINNLTERIIVRNTVFKGLETDYVFANGSDVDDDIRPTVSASANSATNVGETYSRAEVQAILDELRDLKTKMRAAGILTT